jgi:hypothetical protein
MINNNWFKVRSGKITTTPIKKMHWNMQQTDYEKAR